MTEESIWSEDLVAWLSRLKAAAPHLTLGQVIVLLQVARHEGVQIGALTQLCDEPTCNISRYVRRMTGPDYAGSLAPAYGLLELLQSPRDRRGRHVALSEEGRRLIGRPAERTDGGPPIGGRTHVG